jgi:SnoaL-like polyketide cyclase
MSEGWLDRYLDAWVLHCFAGGSDGREAAERLLGFMGDDVVYEDVPSRSVFEGHQGILTMCSQGHQMSADLMYEIVSRQTDGRWYAFESVGKGTNTGAVGPIPSTGRPFELRVMSVGELGNGVVHAHRDYWDLAGLLTQLGVMPATPRA